MLNDAMIHFNIMCPPGNDKTKISYYDLLVTEMHKLGRHTVTGFIPQTVEFGLIPLPDENIKEIEILKATKDFINFWIEYGYIGYQELVDNLEALSGLAWDLSGDMMQFRFTTLSVNGELPKAYFYLLDVALMRSSFVKKP